LADLCHEIIGEALRKVATGMQTLDYYLPRPQFDLTPEKQEAFEALFGSTPAGNFVDYRLPYPKWEYLSYLCETKEMVLHGSQVVGIDVVEPRQSFQQEAMQHMQGMDVVLLPHWISETPALPIAQLIVSAQDFPFLDQIHGHNDAKLVQLATADPNSFPWLEALEC
jgi:hypothetical protein